MNQALTLPLSVTIGAQTHFGTYTVDRTRVRVKCGKLDGEADLGERQPRRAAEALLRAMVAKAAKDRR